MKKKPTAKATSPDCSGGGAATRRIAKLLEELRTMLSHQQTLVQRHWNRSLPFADYIVDRWERAHSLGFGQGTSIYDSALVLGDVKIGRNTWIGPFTVLDGSGGLQIGDNCSISAGVQIYTHDTVKWAVTGGKAQTERSPVCIGNNCYIGPNALVSKGVTIGSGCIVGANSLVNRDVPAGTKVWGTPARFQGKIDAEGRD